MLDHMRTSLDMGDALRDCLTERERQLIGLETDGVKERTIRERAERTLQEDALAGSQQHVPLSKTRSTDRKDLRPWQGKESDGEIMMAFEDAADAQALYDFVLLSGLVLPGEVKLYVGEHQASVHFAPSVLVQKPEVIELALASFEDQVTEASVPALNALDEALGALQERAERKPSPRGSAEPRVKGKSVDFNPYHNKRGNFTTRAALDAEKAGSWSDGTQEGSRHLKATAKGKKLHFAGTKLPCGRAARRKGGNIRCWDGTVIVPVAKKMVAAFKDRARSGDRPMPGGYQEAVLTPAEARAIFELLDRYGVPRSRMRLAVA